MVRLSKSASLSFRTNDSCKSFSTRPRAGSSCAIWLAAFPVNLTAASLSAGCNWSSEADARAPEPPVAPMSAPGARSSSHLLEDCGSRDLGVRCYENDVEVLVQLRTRVRPGTFRTRPTPDRNGWAGAWRSPCDVRPCNPGGNRRRFPNRVLSLRDTAARSSSRSRRANTVLFVRPVLICGLPAPTVPASNRRLASDPTSPAGFFRFTESGGRIGTCAGLTRRADNRGPLVPRTPARGCCRLRQRSRLCPSGRPRSRSLGCRVSPRTHSR